MREAGFVLVISATLIARPVAAIGLGNIGDLAKTVVKGRSALKKGEQKCGSSLALNASEKIDSRIGVRGGQESNSTCRVCSV